MTDQIKNGGQAFPHVKNRSIDYGNGMSLRDWFAGQVLAGNLGNPYASPADTIAERAYEIADAMLAAREGKA